MKNKFTFLLCLLAIVVGAQPYGHTRYPNGANLTSGSRTFMHSNGFVMAGQRLSIAGSVLRIDKSSAGGAFVGGSAEFQNDYLMAETGLAGCGANTGNIFNFAGASLIEVASGATGAWYIMAGAYNKGCIFSGFTATGAPVNTAVYFFPYQSANIAKPLVVESTQNPDMYYLCGKFDTSMYVIKVAQSGGIIWSRFYSFGHTTVNGQMFGGIVNPQSMIESPFTNNLVVVGDVQGSPSYNRASDGFMLEVDANTGAVVRNLSYGNYAPNPGSCTRFNAIAPALSTSNGGPGYVIGGYSDSYGTVPLNTGHCWILKVAPSGGILWNRIFTPSSDIGAGNVFSIVERQNTSANYEYYALSDMSNIAGEVVLKLNAAGLPVASNSEFYYNPSTLGGPFTPKMLDCKNPAGGAPDVGLHVYANANAGFYLTEAYFNGQSGCNQNITNILTYETGGNAIQPWSNVYGGFNYCSDFKLTATASPFTPNQYCTANSLTGGSNARVITSVNSAGTPVAGTGAYPNPTAGKFTLHASIGAQVIIYNAAGAIVAQQKLEAAETEFNLGGKESGLYLVRITDGDQEQVIRMVKE